MYEPDLGTGPARPTIRSAARSCGLSYPVDHRWQILRCGGAGYNVNGHVAVHVWRIGKPDISCISRRGVRAVQKQYIS
jgi:hypothetical protein